jgi:4a-hydroxytetrahydrobiopterin dehydratase
MASSSSDPLPKRHCQPCEGGIEKLTSAQVDPLLQQVPQWQLDESGDAIFRKIKLRDFVSAIALINRIAEIAEEEQHHPDLHVTGYRHLRIDLKTHAIGGLSENDFILAAKIDQVAGD